MENRTVPELTKLAARKGIVGRSRMNKRQLITALRRAS
ncbi:MAG: Rho termination factor N-terminal domain-containing protein [Actinomycetota bacterium]